MDAHCYVDGVVHGCCVDSLKPHDCALVVRVQDPSKPKRAMSAFFLYSQANRSRVKEENGEASFGEIVSDCCEFRLVYMTLFWFCCYLGVIYDVLEVVWWVFIGNPNFSCFHCAIMSIHYCVCAPPR